MTTPAPLPSDDHHHNPPNRPDPRACVEQPPVVVDALEAPITAEWDVSADPVISDPDVEAMITAAVAEAANPLQPGLELTVDDALEFGRRWYRTLTATSCLALHRADAERLFGRWTAALLAALGAPVPDPGKMLTPTGKWASPTEIGYDLAHGHRLSADNLGLCVSLLSDLAAEFTPRARRAVTARVVGEFSSGFAEGLQERVRDDQTALTSAVLNLGLAVTGDGTRARRFRAAVTSAITAVLRLDENGKIIDANSAAVTLLGRPLAQLREAPVTELAFYDEDAEELRRALATLPRDNHHGLPDLPQVTTEFRIRADAQQPPRWATATIGRDHDHVEDGDVTVVLSNVTFVRALEHGIDIEPTTGLLTEVAFAQQTRRILTDTPEPAALLTIRLTGWAHLDHVLPHDLRARLLSQLHARIRGVHDPARHRQLVGRHGDDVLVLLYDLTDWTTVIHLVKQLSDWLQDPVRIDAHQIRLRPRIGIAEAHPADTLDDLLRRTRRALHDTDDHRAPWIHADPPAHQPGRDDHHRLELLAELATALDTGTLHMDYQPIHTADGRLAAVRPQPYWLSPDETRRDLCDITDLADHTGLLAAALPHILTRGADDVVIWAAARDTAPTLLLSLPGSTVHDEPLLDTLTTLAADSGIQPGRLQLAVPAHALTGQPAVLRRLRELPAGHTGIRLALTDVLDDHIPLQAFTTVDWATIALTAPTVSALTATPAGALPLNAALSTIRALGAQALTDHPPTQHTGRIFDLYQHPTPRTTAEIAQLIDMPG
ncbi:EAL domain-containing protein [Amycolatopsis sp. cmx-4-54]|uniref:EAL domain-containing protein n=1 Tax=Amycolatopsis sp. cmx-4-54 TaxID=2790936 RepID=UPI003978E06A